MWFFLANFTKTVGDVIYETWHLDCAACLPWSNSRLLDFPRLFAARFQHKCLSITCDLFKINNIFFSSLVEMWKV